MSKRGDVMWHKLTVVCTLFVISAMNSLHHAGPLFQFPYHLLYIAPILDQNFAKCNAVYYPRLK